MRKLWFVVIFLIGLVFTIFGGVSFLVNQKIATISNFEECADAGYPIMESYPARCMTPDKRSFTQELSAEEKKRLVPPTEQVSCGNGICEEITCDATGCPDPETPISCPQDCPYDR